MSSATGSLIDPRQLNREKLWDLVATILIAAVGLAVAYVTFGVLDSQAEGDVAQYSVGGAIAGFLVTVSVLGTFYLQQRRSSGEVDGLRRENDELRQKLIRAAPRPETFEVEVDERQRIVLARPEYWEPRGGIILDFQLRESDKADTDIFPARFVLSYVPITEDTEAEDQFYKHVREEETSTAAAAWIGPPTHEFVYLGDPLRGIKSLKSLYCEYARVTAKRDPVTGKVKYDFDPIQRDVYEEEAETSRARGVSTSPPAEANGDGEVEAPGPALAATGIAHPSEAPQYLIVQRMTVTCYHEALKTVFFFNFLDDAEDFPTSSASFNQLLNSARFLT